MKWLFKSKKFIAVDIGSDTIKLCEFSRNKKKEIVLENFIFLPVPDNCIEQGDLINLDPLKESFSDFLSQNVGEKVNTVLYASMSGRSILAKKLDVLRSEKKELMDDLVQEEMVQSLPFNIDEINYNYFPLESYHSPNENMASILVVAAKSDNVAVVDQLFKSTGYPCAGVDMGALALAECVRFLEEDLGEKENILLLDIGKSGTNFIVLNNKDLLFSRYISVGSNFYTVNLMKEMSIEYEEAESLKISWCSGGEAPPEVNSIVEESHGSFCEEVFIGLEYFKNQFPDLDLLKIYVTGGGSKIPNLVSAISKKFNISSTAVLDPFTTVQSSDLLEDSLSDIKHFIACLIGLYLRGSGK